MCKSSHALESCDLGCTPSISAYDAKKKLVEECAGRGFIGNQSGLSAGPCSLDVRSLEGAFAVSVHDVDEVSKQRDIRT